MPYNLLKEPKQQLYQPPANSLDGSEREHNAGLSLNVGVEDTKNVLEVGRHHQRHGGVGLLSETSTHSTISELLSRNERIVHQEFLKGQCSVPETGYSFSSERILALGFVTLELNKCYYHAKILPIVLTIIFDKLSFS